MKGQINGLNIEECHDFIKEIDNLEAVKCNYYIQESFIEFKSIFTPIIISFSVGVASGIVANVIYNFLKKKKDEGKNVSISIENVNIYFGDNTKTIEDKIKKLKNK